MTSNDRTTRVPVTELAIGEEARVAELATRSASVAHQLASLGLSPGVPIRLNQRWPSYVITCEETEIAIEESIAATIFVHRNGD